MRYSCCLPRDGDVDVREDRGAAFEIRFSNRDPSSKCTKAPAFDSNLTAREDNVSSVHAQIQTRAHAGKIQLRQQKTQHKSTCSHNLLCISKI